MKLKITTDSGFDYEYDIDEDSATEVGERGELIRLRMERNTMTERFAAMVHDKQVLESANKACADEISRLRDNLTAAMDRADGWEKRSGELEQDIRDAQGKLDESVKCEARMGLENSKLRSQIEELQDRIHEMDWTIARYDDENRYLHNKLEMYETEAAKLVWKWDKGSTTLTSWAKRIHDIAVQHGWWETEEGKCDDGDRPLPEILMLCVCELAEAMEEYRKGKPLVYKGEDGKPEGIAVEMVDCVIRIFDWMSHNNVDVDAVAGRKVEYNKGRSHRHGGKKA